MNITKELEKSGIEPVRQLDFNEIYKISRKIIELLKNSFPNYDIKEEEILKKMFQSKIYYANISQNIGKASYFYKNSVIYIDTQVDINNLDEYVIHEIMHYLQEEKDEKGKLIKIGICKFKEFGISGFAINEAAIQYIISKMLNIKKNDVSFFGIEVKTISKHYYPLLSVLIDQIVYIVGEEALLDGILKSNNNFENAINKYYGYEEYNHIQKKFDNLLDIRQKIKKSIEEKNNTGKEQLIIKLKKNFLETQKYLYTKYFNYYLEIIENIKDIDEIKKELNEYSKIIQTQEGLKEFYEYASNLIEIMDRKSINIYRKNTKNNLAVISNSRILKIIKYIKNFFIKNKYKNEENKF